jgi:hypothetical protein
MNSINSRGSVLSRGTAVAAALIFAGGCSSTVDPEGAEPVPAGRDAIGGGSPSKTNGDTKSEQQRRRADRKKGGGSARRNKGGAKDARPSNRDSSARERSPRKGARRSRSPGPRSHRVGQTRYPAAGGYGYAQNGYEEFCSPTCSRRSLPRSQVVRTTYQSRARSGAVVVTEMRSSDDLIRTTTLYTKGAAFIKEVYVRMSDGGFTFSQTYRPKPPVQSLVFPLSRGRSWSGRWRGRVSGDYRVRVTGSRSLSVGGRRVKAVGLDTLTHFRGQFRGRANATSWIDPDTAAPVETAGNTSLKSTFGTYRTAFHTRLQSGPGYR